MIVPTYQLHLASISCAYYRTSYNFWQRLCAFPHYASMIRQIEICDDMDFEYLFDCRRRAHYGGQRIGEDFSELSSEFPVPPALVDVGYGKLLSQSFSYMDGLVSMFVYLRESSYEYDCYLPHWSKKVSNTLKTLQIHYETMELPSDFTPPQFGLSVRNI